MDSQTLRDMHDLVREHLEPAVIGVAAHQVLVTSNEHTVHDLHEIFEKHLPHPKRPKGTSVHQTLDSLIAHAQRHSDPGETVAFCNLTNGQGRIIAVYDYHPAEMDRGGWRQHHAVYDFPLTDAWKRWTSLAGRSLSVQEFAELLEERIEDVRDPSEAPELPGVTYATASELLTLAQGLSVRVEQQVAEVRRLHNGTSQIQFSEEHKGPDGTPVRVPTGFLLGLQVFLGGEAYPIPARLRYRVKDRQITWQIGLHDAEGIRRAAIEAAAKRFAEQTKLPLFFGTPDA